MIFKFIGGIAGVLACVAGGAAAAPATLAYWEDPGSTASLVAEAGTIRQLATDCWAVDKTGEVTGSVPTAAMRVAAQYHIATFAVISNYDLNGFDGSIVHALLTHPAAEARVLTQMTALAARNDYTGINIDFEALLPNDRAKLSRFIAKAAARLHAGGKLLVMSIPAMLRDDPSDSWAGAYDLAVLGQALDIVQYMTYDENGPWGPPGPVAGLDWVKPAADYAVSVVPAKKLSLGVPAYGYDWDTTAGTGIAVAWKDIPALIAATEATPSWDAASASPYFDYTRDGDRHVVWYENARSIALKAWLATALRLDGTSTWVLGDENAGFWRALKQGGQ